MERNNSCKKEVFVELLLWSYDWYYTILFFIAYSVGGWVCESVYCSVLDGRVINRGFLNGPVCPIYGTGAMLVVIFLLPVQNSLLLVFLLGMVMTSALEYLTSVVMEKLFHARWWDYSQHRFHIHGRVCLLNSTLFGLMSMVLMKWIHPFFSRVILSLPPMTAKVLACSSLIVLAADTVVTVHMTLSLNGKLAELRELADELKYSTEARKWYYEHRIHQTLKAIREQIGEEHSDLAERTEKRLHRLAERRFGHERLLDAFPTMRHIKHKEQLEALREEWKIQRRELKERVHRRKAD